MSLSSLSSVLYSNSNFTDHSANGVVAVAGAFLLDSIYAYNNDTASNNIQPKYSPDGVNWFSLLKQTVAVNAGTGQIPFGGLWLPYGLQFALGSAITTSGFLVIVQGRQG